MVYTLRQGGEQMPWKVLSQMELKMQLVRDWNEKHMNVTDLAQKFKISRPTVYKWLQRHEQLGVEGLKEVSRAPKHSPYRTAGEIVDLIVAEKLKNRKWGPRKIRAHVKREHPELSIPAVSTVGYWLKKEGLVQKRKKRPHVPPYTQPFYGCEASNDTWSIDYKGQFFMKNGCICYPLTITDNYSRFLLGCEALEGPRYEPTRRSIESIFRQYGLPDAIRTDNGVPFAGKGIGGLSRLTVWWILLGIIPERIGKGCPHENGRHERMHRTLKEEALSPVAADLKAQQEAFDRFRYEYNTLRPHESLGDGVPHEHYTKSTRPYVENPHPPEYGHDYTVRQVRHSGEIKFAGRMIYVSELLSGLPVGLKETDDGLWKLCFSFYTLGSLDLKKNRVIRNG